MVSSAVDEALPDDTVNAFVAPPSVLVHGAAEVPRDRALLRWCASALARA